jgi:hypothetical protein
MRPDLSARVEFCLLISEFKRETNRQITPMASPDFRIVARLPRALCSFFFVLIYGWSDDTAAHSRFFKLKGQLGPSALS